MISLTARIHTPYSAEPKQNPKNSSTRRPAGLAGASGTEGPGACGGSATATDDGVSIGSAEDSTCTTGAVTGIVGSGGGTGVACGEGREIGTAESTALPRLGAGRPRDIGFRERLLGRRSLVMRPPPGSSPPPG